MNDGSDNEYLITDVVIAGAGIVGAACAAALAKEGLRVVLVEPFLVGGGATAAGMGHLTVMDDSPAQFALTLYSQSLWKKLAEQLPADAEYLPCGAIWVASDEFEMNEVHRKAAYYSAGHVQVEVLDERSLAEAEPNLRTGLTGGLFVKDDAVVYPPCAARYLLAQSQNLGAVLLQGRTVVELLDGRVRLDDGTFLAASATILANGIDARLLVPELPVQPRKGHLLITDRYPGFVRHQLIELGYLKSAHASDADSVAFNVQPRKTGQLLIGSSRQYGVEDTQIDDCLLSQMLKRAIELMPGIRHLVGIRAWTGFRAATPDKLPLIGRCPECSNVFLATGHEGLGITTSLGTAQLLADEIMGRSSLILREPYSPSRIYAVHA